MNNSCDTDFEIQDFEDEEEIKVFGYHSGCFVVLAKDLDDAKSIARGYNLKFTVEPQEIDLAKRGLVAYSDGDC